MTIDTIGNTGYDVEPMGTLHVFAITASASGVLQSIGVNIKTATGNIRVGIYSTYSGGQCSGLLGESASTAATTLWNDLAIPGGVTITASTTYYIAFQCSAWGLFSYGVASGTHLYKTLSYAAFPDPTGALSSEAWTAYMRMTYAPDTTEYIDSTSDVDSVADIGTHSAFANQQADDSNSDTLTEALSSGVYKLEIEEQFSSVDYAGFSHAGLIVKTGDFSGEALWVEVWDASESEWVRLTPSLASNSLNTFNIEDYVTSANVYIRFVDHERTGDTSTQDTWEIQAVYLEDQEECTVVVSCPTGHGTPSPAVDTYTYGVNYWLPLAAGTPDSGYELDHIKITMAGLERYQEGATTLYIYGDATIEYYYRPVIPASTGYQIIYYDSSAGIWKSLSSTSVLQVTENRRGVSEAAFTIPNTSGNRTALNLTDVDSANAFIKILYGSSSTEVFTGQVTGAKMTTPMITCYCCDAILTLLEMAPHLITYTFENTSAYAIIAIVAQSLSGVDHLTLSSSNFTDKTISISFNGENALAAVKQVCEKIGCDLWSELGAPYLTFGMTIYIGNRSTTVNAPTKVMEDVSHTFDRKKVKGTVIVIGASEAGDVIQGSYGSSGAIMVETDFEAKDVTTLNTIAEQIQAKNSSPTVAIPIRLLTSEAYSYHAGEAVTLTKAALLLDDDYIIDRIVKGPSTTSIEVDVQELRTDEDITRLEKNVDLMARTFLGTIYTPISQVQAPLIDIPSGTYTTSQTVSIICPTSGATIYYTTDGSTPDSSDTEYTTALTISTTTTLKAIALKDGYADSSVSTATYTIDGGYTGTNIAPMYQGEVSACRWGDADVFGEPRYDGGTQITWKDDSVTHDGNSSIRIEAPNAYNPTRELNHQWRSVNVGDHIVMTCYVKTAALTSGTGLGAIIGFDCYGLDSGGTWRRLVEVHPRSPQLGIWNQPQTGVPVYVPYGADWTLVTLDVTIPTTAYTQDANGVSITATQISVIVPFCGVSWHNQDMYPNAWFADAELYINPS